MPRPVFIPLPVTNPAVGRPRVKPANTKPRTWWATDREYDQVKADAAEAGVSVQEYMRRLAIRDPDPVS